MKRGVVKKSGLNEEEVSQVRALQAVCNQYERLDVPVNLEMAGSVSGNETKQFLYYENGELIGLLSFIGGGDLGSEVSLMVHPEHRRKGVGSALLAAVREECKTRNVREWLLVCEESSVSGRAFVEALAAQYRFSEYRMKFEENGTRKPQSRPSSMSIRRAEIKDLEILARLTAVSFGGSEEETRQRMSEEILKPTHRFYIARLQEEPVGSLGVVSYGNRVYIIAFGVHPNCRGRGYGHQLLAWVINTLVSEGQKEIYIEVATKNRNARSLYRSCGFREITTYGYYHMDL